MKRLVFRSALLISVMFVVSCNPSAKGKGQAHKTYKTVQKIVQEVLLSEKTFVSCLRYTVKKVQDPLVAADKSKFIQLKDSCKALPILLEGLCETIKNSLDTISVLNEHDQTINIVQQTDVFIKAYDETINNYYRPLTNELNNLEPPFNNNKLKNLLSVCYKADSTLNGEADKLNKVVDKFVSKYELKEQ